MINITIRRYQKSDNEQVKELHHLALQKERADYRSGPWDDDLNDIHDHYIDNKGEFLVGFIDGKMVAMGALRKLTEELGEIKRMRVHPDYQRLGLGQKILDLLERKARELGYKTLQLDTTELQLAAQIFYKKNGYKEVRREPLGILGLVNIYYEKVLL